MIIDVFYQKNINNHSPKIIFPVAASDGQNIKSKFMNREFLINISFLLTINLLIKPFFLFGIDRTIQNTVGESEYGLYATLFDFTFLFYILNDIGTQYFNSRTISQHNYLIDKYLPNLLSLKIVLSIVFFIAIGIGTWLMGYPENYYPIIAFVGINHVLISLVAFLRTNVSGLGMYRTDSLISALDKLLLIGLCSVLLWGNISSEPFQIEWLIWAQTIAWIITIMVLFIILNKKVKSWRLRFNPVFWKAILKQSYPFAIVFLLMTIYTRVDKVMIERMLINGQAEAGIYTAGYRLLDASNMIGYLFAGLLLPMFSKMLKQKENLQSLVDLSFQMIMAGAMTVAISICFFREEIMFLLYDNATVYYADIMRYLILSFIAVAGVYIYSTLLTANASLKKMNWLFMMSIVINVGLNYILIQKMKAEGAAIATLVTQFFVLFGTMYFAKKEVGVNVSLKMLIKIVSFAAVFGVICFQIYEWQTTDWLFKFGGCILIGIVLSFVFKLINPKLFLDMIAKRGENPI
ncbi:MAG: O-antigen/teichoic acid export membrane protein [Paraglaciecola sp.]